VVVMMVAGYSQSCMRCHMMTELSQWLSVILCCPHHPPVVPSLPSLPHLVPTLCWTRAGMTAAIPLSPTGTPPGWASSATMSSTGVPAPTLP
jgi:hypothetical protein